MRGPMDDKDRGRSRQTSARQREVLTAIARQLSKDKVSQFLHVAEATTNIDAEALLQRLRYRARALSKTRKLRSIH